MHAPPRPRKKKLPRPAQSASLTHLLLDFLKSDGDPVYAAPHLTNALSVTVTPPRGFCSLPCPAPPKKNFLCPAPKHKKAAPCILGLIPFQTICKPKRTFVAKQQMSRITRFWRNFLALETAVAQFFVDKHEVCYEVLLCIVYLYLITKKEKEKKTSIFSDIYLEKVKAFTSEKYYIVQYDLWELE